MSERIKELMKKAGTDTSGKWMGVEHAEKFTELIVAECIDAIEKANKHQAYTTYDLAMVQSTMEKCVNEVKARFQ